ncbi:SDR family oxidoreductase [Bacillus pacificus]
MELLQGKHLLLWKCCEPKKYCMGIARSLHNAGAKLIFTYAGERLERNVRELADTLEGQESLVLPCDVTNDEELTACFETIKQSWYNSRCSALYCFCKS